MVPHVYLDWRRSYSFHLLGHWWRPVANELFSEGFLQVDMIFLKPWLGAEYGIIFLVDLNAEGQQIGEFQTLSAT
jgi:hypothetical protein